MKCIVITAAITLFLISCKKDGGDHPKETLLVERSVDGLRQLRFEYNGDNLLTKIEGYKTDPADNSMTSYIVFQYNDKKHITQFTSYQMPGNTAAVKATFDYDSLNRLVKGYSYELQGVSPNTPYSTSTFTYNAKGEVIKTVEKNKSGELTLQRNLIYYDDGHIKELQSWKQTDDKLWMSGKVSYSIPSGNYATGIEQLRVILGTDFIASMYSESISYLTYSQAGVITKNTNELMSAREFNEDGTLKKQVATMKYIKPEFEDAVSVEEFKYVQQ